MIMFLSCNNMMPKMDVDEVNCENVMECLYDLSELDKDILSLLSEDEDLRSSELAERIDKDQSTVYRSLERLLECGLIYKEKETIRNGGYYFLYSRRPVDKIKEEAKACVERWYEEMRGAIEEIEDI